MIDDVDKKLREDIKTKENKLIEDFREIIQKHDKDINESRKLLNERMLEITRIIEEEAKKPKEKHPIVILVERQSEMLGHIVDIIKALKRIHERQNELSSKQWLLEKRISKLEDK